MARQLPRWIEGWYRPRQAQRYFQVLGIVGWDKYVKQDPRFMRPAEVAVLCGDATKAREKLGWIPKTSFEEMVSKMVANDINLLS